MANNTTTSVIYVSVSSFEGLTSDVRRAAPAAVDSNRCLCLCTHVFFLFSPRFDLSFLFSYYIIVIIIILSLFMLERRDFFECPI